jgi:hypothetical protein
MVVVDCYKVIDDDGSAPVIVTLRMTQAEADALIANFDPASATSPPAADCRAVARPIATAVAELVTP